MLRYLLTDGSHWRRIHSCDSPRWLDEQEAGLWLIGPPRLGQKKHLAVFLSERAVFTTAGWRQILLPSCWNLSHSFPTCLVPTSKSFAYSSTLESSTEAEVIWLDHCCSLSDLKMSQKACKRKEIGIFWKPKLKTWKKSCIVWQQVSHTCGLAFTPADSNQLKATTSPS